MSNVIDLNNLKAIIEKQMWAIYNPDPNKETNWAFKLKNNANEFLKDNQGNDVEIRFNITVMRDLIANIIFNIFSGLSTNPGTLTASAIANYETGNLTSGKGTAQAQTEIAGILNIAGGTNGAARNGDSVSVSLATNDTINCTYTPPVVSPPALGYITITAPKTIIGTITSGSSKVKVG